MIISIVILHYLTIDDTIECIENILRLKTNNIALNIIVVDNGSCNGTGLVLENKYKCNNNIKIILNSENVGFARGNNIGYKYGKEVKKSDFIICINNDIIIKDENFLLKILNSYKVFHFHCLGPKIISLKDNKNQNPVLGKKYLNYSKIDCFKDMMVYIFLLFIIKINIYDLAKNNFKKKTSKAECILNNNNDNKCLENIVLHGACMIYSSLYIQKMDYAFYPKTFMYMEENILFEICKRRKFKTLYNPNIIVYHKEDSSTDFLCDNNKSKRIFVLKNLIKSSYIYIRYL